MLCTRCGADVEQGMKFCTSCGAPMTDPGEHRAPPESTQATGAQEELPTYYPETSPSTPPEKKPDKTLLYSILGLVVVIILAGAGVGTWLLLRSSDESVAEVTTTTVATPTTAPAEVEPAPSTTTTTAFPTEELLASVMPNVVLVDSGRKTGTGFLVGKGEVITAAHVVEESLQVAVRYGADQRATGNITHFDERRGLAVISITGFNGEPLPILRQGTLQKGDDVLVVGWSSDEDAPAGNATVDDPHRESRGVRHIKLDSAVDAGSSGSPIVNADGEVIGMVTTEVTDTEGKGFGVAYNEIEAFLSECDAGQWAYEPSFAITTTTTEQPAYTGPSGTWYRHYGWTVVVYSITEAEGGQSEAYRQAAYLDYWGYPAGYLYSSHFRSLNPGYWVTYSGEFDTKSQADSHARHLKQMGYTECYPREIAR